MTATSQRQIAVIWALLGVLSLLMVGAPFFWNLDMSSGGGALVFLGVIGLISSMVVASIFFSRASTLDKMLSAEDLLVDWDQPEHLGGKTVISLDGMLTNKLLYTFKDLSCTLREIELLPAPNSPRQIRFTIEVPSRFGTKSVRLEVQIPEGQADRAKEAFQTLRTHYFGKGQAPPAIDRR